MKLYVTINNCTLWLRLLKSCKLYKFTVWCVITVLATQKTFYKLANQDTWTCLLAKFNRQVMQQHIIENTFCIFWTRRKIFVGGLDSFVDMQEYYWVTYIHNCAAPENIPTPLTEGIGISWGVRGSLRPKNLKKCSKLN